MSILSSPDTVTVWMESGRPARLLWNHERYTVSDTPTPLGSVFEHELLTHPIDVVGWRFQGTNDAGRSLVFDVVAAARQEWRLVAIYD